MIIVVAVSCRDHILKYILLQRYLSCLRGCCRSQFLRRITSWVCSHLKPFTGTKLILQALDNGSCVGVHSFAALRQSDRQDG